jgi:lambda family phage portal protein
MRSIEMFETNLYGRGLIRRLVTNEVHTGLSLEADPDAEILGLTEDEVTAWSDRVESYYNAWASTPDACDHERRPDMTHGELTAMARREALVGGDVLVVTRMHAVTKLPTVQLYPAHMVKTPFNAHESSAEIIDGVELNAAGRQVAYHVQLADGSFQRFAARGARSGRRQAWLMYGTDRRTGQVRGTPLLGVVLQSLKEIDRYRDATQRKAIINSIVTMWIEKSEDKLGSNPLTQGAQRAGTVQTVDNDGDPRTFNVADQIPGLVLEELQHGETPHSFKSDTGDTVQFPEFEAAIVSAIAWHCEIPPEILRLSFDKNYSASQAALNEFTLYLDVQRDRIARSFNQPIYEQWLEASTLRGTISANLNSGIANFEVRRSWMRADWYGAAKPVTDALKLMKATELALSMGLTTRHRAARMYNGSKFSTNARHLRRELEELPRVETEGTANDATILDDSTE